MISFAVLGSRKPPAVNHNKFDIMIDAFVRASEIMRYTVVESFSEEIGGIYAAVSGNTYLSSILNVRPTSIVTELRQEISAFIDNRIWFIIESVVNHIVAKYNLSANDIGSTLEINGFRYDSLKGMNLHELQMLEFDILRICEHDSDYKRYENESQSLATSESYDMLSILKMLIYQFELVSGQIKQSTGSFINAKISLRNDNDYGSTRCIVMLGYMIAKVVQSIIIVKCETDNCMDGIKQARHAMINDEYSKYGNIGSMQCSSILSCFKNIKLLPLAVINKDCHLGANEKTLLTNILVLSELA